MDKNDDDMRWKTSTIALLNDVDKFWFQPFSISVVPDELRQWNVNAYMPKAVSIGPRFKGATRDLLLMEEIKWRCVQTLLHRTDRKDQAEDILDKGMQLLLDKDGAVRACYADEIKLDRHRLATTMFYDGCFLLELLISASKDYNERLARRSEGYDAWKAIKGKKNAVLTDLTLLENQIPLFIIFLLATTFFPDVFAISRGVHIIEKLTLSSLGFQSHSNFDALGAGHFLELTYTFMFHKSPLQEKHHSEDSVEIPIFEGPCVVKLNRCATRLQADGVKIKAADISQTDRCVAPSRFSIDINFSDNGELEIPPLRITETVEANWRNFIAWEHQNCDRTSHRHTGKCTWSALFFNGMICCASDIKLLKDKGIIVDYSKKSNQDLVDFFHSIKKGVDPSIIGSDYADILFKLNKYSETKYATKIPIILWHYLPQIPEKADQIYRIHGNFFRRGYNFVAALISLLAVVQTVFAVLSFRYQK